MKTTQIIAAGALALASKAAAESTLFSGSGFGTFYYNLGDTDVCNYDLSSMDNGDVECSNSALTLNEINSPYLVAMNHSQLDGNLGTYCGKKLVVKVNGVASDLPLFIGDGCERCGNGTADQTEWDQYGAPGLDFSYEVAMQLNSDACSQGHFDITWEILDETIYDFDTSTGSTGSSGGSGSSSVAVVPTATAATSSYQAQATTLKTTYRPAAASTNPVVAVATPSTSSSSSSSGSCVTGAWQCSTDGTELQQCLNSVWTTRETCSSGLTCQGGSNPYCAAASS